MAEITIQHYYKCYEYGVQAFDKKISKGTAALKASETGMDKGSARIYVNCVCSLLSGERYTATVKELALSYFLTQILSDYKMEGLRNALKSVKLHLEYQSKYQQLNNIQKLYDEFTSYLN